jgi:hypothetical protein
MMQVVRFSAHTSATTGRLSASLEHTVHQLGLAREDLGLLVEEKEADAAERARLQVRAGLAVDITAHFGCGGRLDRGIDYH